ncbi:LysR substrate-binding domain-containing protein [Variovorax sp. RCC_210]|uniref:LysR substrate-binding domain-containing protein n=1 Tax=Variovorax sp. RCC_210 TaxID=3239217 RepID=UPI003524DE74
MRLLVRTTRQVRTTVDGQGLLRTLPPPAARARGRRVVAGRAVRQPARAAAHRHPRRAGNELGLPRIGEFHARYPHIELAVGSGDRLVDLVREGVDCVVRAGKPKDSSLVTRRLALIPQVTVASPAYLAANGTPLQPADLARHWAVNFFSASRTDFFPFDFEVEAVRRRTCCAAGSA